jgi:hypothetical protein
MHVLTRRALNVEEAPMLMPCCSDPRNTCWGHPISINVLLSVVRKAELLLLVALGLICNCEFCNPENTQRKKFLMLVVREKSLANCRFLWHWARHTLHWWHPWQAKLQSRTEFISSDEMSHLKHPDAGDCAWNHCDLGVQASRLLLRYACQSKVAREKDLIRAWTLQELFAQLRSKP